MLAIAGGLGGMFLGAWLARGLVRFLPYDPAALSLSTTPDARVLLFTMAVTVRRRRFGLLPAFRGSRVQAAMMLKAEAGSVTGGQGHVRHSEGVRGASGASSLLLLIGAGLFVRTLDNLRKVDLGFTTENVRCSPYGRQRSTTMAASSMCPHADRKPGDRPRRQGRGANTSRLLTGGRWTAS